MKSKTLSKKAMTATGIARAKSEALEGREWKASLQTAVGEEHLRAADAHDAAMRSYKPGDGAWEYHSSMRDEHKATAELHAEAHEAFGGPMTEASMIAPNLWQGSFPMPGGGLRRDGFDVVVFCAMEVQPPSSMYPGMVTIYAPNDDDSSRQPTREEIEIARKASRLVASYVASGKKVLVTCMAGRNRSGLVTAMALCRLYGLSGSQALTLVKSRRRTVLGEALTNERFAELLHGYHRGDGTWLRAPDPRALRAG